jgi:ribosome-associated protein
MLVDTIVDKKGSNIILLDIRDQATFADYFLICSGENIRQIDALAEEITLKVKRQLENPTVGIEGSASSGWILIDLGDLVVHVFSPEKRDYYQLEDIWDHAHVVMRMQ